MSVAKIARLKKMKPALTKPFCSVYIVSDGSMGEIVLAHEPPLDDVRDHEQVQKDQRRRAPPAGL